MRSLFVFVAVLGASHATYPWTNTYPGPFGYAYEVPCTNYITNEIVFGYRDTLYDMITPLFHKIVALSDAHFTFSPYTIWKALAAIAEGSQGLAREELFTLLRLPEDKCVRQLYYQLASSVEGLSSDVVLERNRLFISDSSVILNKNWVNFVKTHKLIDVAQIPYKSNPNDEIQSWKQTFDAQLPNLNLNGNSLILESLDFHGLWTFAFSEASIVKEPFYNVFGKQIATMEYMKMKKRVNIAYLPSRNMKIMELPVGKGGRYRMLFGLVMTNVGFRSTLDVIPSSVIYEALSSLKKSQVPIDVVIPRVAMTSETDVRRLLKEVGVSGIWSDPYATRNISEPAALPSSFIQRVTVTLDNSGVMPSIQEYSNFIPYVPCEPSYGGTNTTDPTGEFIANRPFLFGLFDTDTYTCMFASSFSKPT